MEKTTAAPERDAATTTVLTVPARLPCRTPGCSNTRPVVAVGCAAGFDRCHKCYTQRLPRLVAA